MAPSKNYLAAVGVALCIATPLENARAATRVGVTSAVNPAAEAQRPVARRRPSRSATR